MAKKLLPLDALVAGYLRDGLKDADLSYRQIAALTGMSINRIGIILRQEPPPATLGEINLLGAPISQSASALIARAEAELAAGVSDDSGNADTAIEPRQSDYTRAARKRSQDRGEDHYE